MISASVVAQSRQARANTSERDRTAEAVAKLHRLLGAGVVPASWVPALEEELWAAHYVPALLDGARHKRLVADTLALPEPPRIEVAS